MTLFQQPLLEVDPFARHSEDWYRTPGWQTQSLIARTAMRHGWRGPVFECAAGDGAIVRQLPPGCDVTTNDIVPREPLIPDFLLDARKAESWDAFERAAQIDVVISNLPFDVAFDIVRHSVERARVASAFLLRLSWLEPTDDRGDWLAEHPPLAQIVLPRYDYRGNGKTDSVTSCWFVWGKPSFCHPGIAIVPKAERDLLTAKYGER